MLRLIIVCTLFPSSEMESKFDFQPYYPLELKVSVRAPKFLLECNKSGAECQIEWDRWVPRSPPLAIVNAVNPVPHFLWFDTYLQTRNAAGIEDFC
jgi:hypothetical protein